MFSFNLQDAALQSANQAAAREAELQAQLQNTCRATAEAQKELETLRASCSNSATLRAEVRAQELGFIIEQTIFEVCCCILMCACAPYTVCACNLHHGHFIL
jgi:hypothetical protein